MPLKPPPQVQRAIFLLWASLALSIIDSVFSFDAFEEAGTELQVAMALVLAVGFIVTALLIHLISRRYNWARIVLLLLVVSGLGMNFAWPPDFRIAPWWSWALTGVGMALDVAGLVMLFSSSGSKWFSSRAAA